MCDEYTQSMNMNAHGNLSNIKRFYTDEEYDAIVKWALNIYPNGLPIKKISEENRAAAKNNEKQWGNLMINQISNTQWTTKLGERIVHDVLVLRGESPRKPIKKEGYQPDWETDDYIYEVKTRNWTTTGTCGEKVLGTPYKYMDIPEIYGKPLRIVCVAYQEWELTNTNLRVFGELTARKRAFIDYIESQDISYIKFSELVKDIYT